jgi:hypothetical protein
MFVAIIVLYIGVGVTLVLILRAMSGRWRATPELAEHEVPYGPREPVAVGSHDGGDSS